MGAFKGYVPGVGRELIATKGAPGPAGLTYEGAYDGGTTYAPTDWVTYNGSSYVCILASTGNLPTNVTYWAVLASKGDKGDTGDPWDAFKGAYNAGTTYAVNDVVSYDGSSYICILESTGNVPTNVTYFSMLAAGGEDGDDGADGIYSAIVILLDKKSSGTHGGTFTSGSWQTRTINYEQSDADGICSLSSNQITLAAGTYDVWIRCPAYDVDGHQARLYNTTASALLLTGTNEYAWATDADVGGSVIVGRITVAAGQALEIQHRCETTKSGAGYGVALSFGDEIYTIAMFKKVA